MGIRTSTRGAACALFTWLLLGGSAKADDGSDTNTALEDPLKVDPALHRMRGILSGIVPLPGQGFGLSALFLGAFRAGNSSAVDTQLLAGLIVEPKDNWVLTTRVVTFGTWAEGMPVAGNVEVVQRLDRFVTDHVAIVAGANYKKDPFIAIESRWLVGAGAAYVRLRRELDPEDDSRWFSRDLLRVEMGPYVGRENLQAPPGLEDVAIAEPHQTRAGMRAFVAYFRAITPENILGLEATFIQDFVRPEKRLVTLGSFLQFGLVGPLSLKVAGTLRSDSDPNLPQLRKYDFLLLWGPSIDL